MQEKFTIDADQLYLFILKSVLRITVKPYDRGSKSVENVIFQLLFSPPTEIMSLYTVFFAVFSVHVLFWSSLSFSILKAPEKSERRKDRGTCWVWCWIKDMHIKFIFVLEGVSSRKKIKMSDWKFFFLHNFFAIAYFSLKLPSWILVPVLKEDMQCSFNKLLKTASSYTF